MRDIKLRTRLSKNVYFYIFSSEVKVLGKVLMQMLVHSVQINSCLDSQSKFQFFTLFSGRHGWCPPGVPRKYTNMAAPYMVL